MSIVRFSLLFVVFMDIMSQGLVIPILTTILLDPAQGFLPENTTAATRQFDYGLVMGAFFFAWFFGAAYISKLTDSIGRKEGILICLFGNLLGYILTIVALQMNSFWILLVARIISGFTAGNQPIAQAALIDMSENQEQKTRFLGLVLFAISLGLMVGPLIGGLLSDKTLLGDIASLSLPFYVVSLMVVLNIVLIWIYFRNHRTGKTPFMFKPFEMFTSLWDAARRPVVLKLSLVFFFAQLVLNAFYVFMDNYYFVRFRFDTLQNAIALVVLGAAMAVTSGYLVSPVNQRFKKIPIIYTCLVIMVVSAVLTILNTVLLIAYVLIVPYIAAFAIYYPTILTMFSEAVSEAEQGWVMGVTIALYTLGNGLISIAGGRLMSVSTDMPFYIAIGSALIAAFFMLTLWRGDDMQKLS